MKKNLQTTFSMRQYMLSKDFELYYYSDVDLLKVKDHMHDYYEFYFFIEGDVSIRIEQIEYKLKSGDLIVLLPHIHHHVEIHSKKPYKRFVFWMSKEYYNELLKYSPDYGYLIQYAIQNKEYIFHNDICTFNEIQSKIFTLLEEIHVRKFARETKIELNVNELLLHLNRIVYEKQNPIKEREEISLYQRVAYYIRQHLEEDLSLEQLAEQFFVSKYHIAHVFKKKFGLSVHQYITKKRLIMCQESLASDISIGEICASSGFQDYSCFYRAFKKEYGISPKQYREQMMTSCVSTFSKIKEYSQ